MDKVAFTLVRLTQYASSVHYIGITYFFAYLKRNNLLRKTDQCECGSIADFYVLGIQTPKDLAE